MAVVNEPSSREGVGDVEAQKRTKPAYLDESIINVRVCCPGSMFKLCPCYLISCFSGICMCPFSCVCGCCMYICSCIRGCCMSILRCILGCCKGCKTCAKCLIRCLSRICFPCIRCGRCVWRCSFSCLLKFNCCNFSCGLPCRNPPGCVCIFPCKACGVGFTCPYACCSCGWDHCIKMPVEEQQYWHNQKVSPKQMKMDLQQSKAERYREDTDALRKEIESLTQQLKDAETNVPQTEPKLA